MIRHKLFRRHLLAFAVLAFSAGFFSFPARAQEDLSLPVVEENLFNAKAKAPDINSIPVLANIVRGGAKLYYLGERSGLHGWFIVKEGQIQMIYLSPDRQTLLIGAIFSNQGDNVTGPQVAALARRDREINELLNGASAQQNEINVVGTTNGGAISVPGNPQASSPSAQQLVSGIPSGVTLSPGDRLYQDLRAAAGVDLGKGDGPEIMIVVAPLCPNCKKTWMELRDSVKSGHIRARLIPVYNSVGAEESNMSAQLLRAKDPLDVWDRFVTGEKQALAGTPDEIAVKAVVNNLNLVNKWNIKGYPYLVYRGKDGRVKIVQGRPDRMAAVLLDLGR